MVSRSVPVPARYETQASSKAAALDTKAFGYLFIVFGCVHVALQARNSMLQQASADQSV
jgi:hypothetical protein